MEKRTSIWILCEKAGPRLDYVLDWLSRFTPYHAWQATTDADFWQSWPGPKLGYGCKADLAIPLSGLLGDVGVRSTWQPTWNQDKAHPRLFWGGLEDDLASLFWLLSRYEEYLPFQPDIHERFEASQSWLRREGLLLLPLADILAWRLIDRLRETWPSVHTVSRKPSLRLTYDIDNAYAYKGKGLIFNLLAGLNRWLNGYNNDLGLRARVLWGSQPDPYDSYAFIERLHQTYGLSAQTFFLLGDRTEQDRNLAWDSQQIRGLVARMHKLGPVGIHPSYHSRQNGRLAKEKSRLVKLLGQPVSYTRQHVLRWRFPETPRQLLNQGLTQDYTMGYAESAGFRAGTAWPFRWYDLGTEQPTDLELHPFQLMDASVRWYYHAGASEAERLFYELWHNTQSTGGELTLLFHNESLAGGSGWEAWPETYERMIRLAVGKELG